MRLRMACISSGVKRGSSPVPIMRREISKKSTASSPPAPPAPIWTTCGRLSATPASFSQTSCRKRYSRVPGAGAARHARRRAVGDPGQLLQDVLLETVLEDLRRRGAAHGPDVECLGFEQRGVGVGRALGLDHPLARAGVGPVRLALSSGVDLGLVGRDLGAYRGARLAQRSQLPPQLALVLLLAQPELVLVGVGLLRDPDHLGGGEVHPVLLAGGLCVGDVGVGEADRRQELLVERVEELLGALADEVVDVLGPLLVDKRPRDLAYGVLELVRETLDAADGKDELGRVLDPELQEQVDARVYPARRRGLPGRRVARGPPGPVGGG